jgi:small conductance mechanosensitive channel
MQDMVPMEQIMAEENITVALEWSMRILSGILVLGAGWIIGKYAKSTIYNINQLDETLRVFLGGFAKYVVFAFSGVIVLGQFGVETASLIAVLGAAGLAIGLALQGTLSNIAAGMMLLILRPFNVGDYITFAGNGGTVKNLGLFGTELATPDNVYIFAPNSQIWGNDIYNYSRNLHRRQDIQAGISYSDDIGKALKTIQKILDKEDRLITTEGKEPVVLTDSMGDFSINLIVRFWSKSTDYWQLRWDLTKEIKEALDKEGITIPFPTRTLIHENAEAKAANDTKKTPKKKTA